MFVPNTTRARCPSSETDHLAPDVLWAPSKREATSKYRGEEEEEEEGIGASIASDIADPAHT